MKIYTKILTGIMVSSALSSLAIADNINISGINTEITAVTGNTYYLPNDGSYEYNTYGYNPVLSYVSGTTDVTLDVQGTRSDAIRVGSGASAGRGVLDFFQIAPGSSSTSRSVVKLNGGLQAHYNSGTTSGDGIIGLHVTNYTDVNIYSTGFISAKATGDAGAVGLFLDGSDINATIDGNITAANSSTTAVPLTAVKAVGSNITLTSTALLQASGGTSNIAVDFSNATDSTFNYYTQGGVEGQVLFGTGDTFNIYDSGETSVDQTIVVGGTTPTINAPGGNLIVTTATTNDGTAVTINSKVQHAAAHLPINYSTTNVHASVVNRMISRSDDRLYSTKYSANKDGFNIWSDAYGENRKRPKIGSTHRIHTKFGGITIGADKMVSDNMNAGFFVGGLTSDMKIGLNDNMKIKSNGAVLGAYASTMMNDIMLNGILEVGYVHNRHSKSVYESNLDGNTDKTMYKANNHDYFVSPSVTAAKSIKATDATSVTPSVTLRYTGQKASKINYGNTATAYTVKGRFISSAAAEAKLTTTTALNDMSSVNVYAGVAFTEVISKKATLQNVGSDNATVKVNLNKMSDSDAIVGAKLNVMPSGSALMHVGVEGGKSLRKGDAGQNYSVALNLGVDF